MKIAVIGSRSFNNFSNLKYYLDNINSIYNITCIVSGGAIGADRLAEKYASLLNIPIVIFKPNYYKFGRIAPIIRNADIVKHSDYVLAFWDGKSKGTLNAISTAKKLRKKIKIVKF